MDTMEQTEPLAIIGLELRTSNNVAGETIPGHWDAFFQRGLLDQIPNKVSGDIYGVYTRFDNEGINNEGMYSLIIGAQVTSLETVPEPFVACVVQPSRRHVFPVEKGRPDLVGEAWQAIWQRTDLKKRYIADYEHYAESGEIAILIGIE